MKRDEAIVEIKSLRFLIVYFCSLLTSRVAHISNIIHCNISCHRMYTSLFKLELKCSTSFLSQKKKNCHWMKCYWYELLFVKSEPKKKEKSTFTNHHGAAYLRIRHSCPIRTLSFFFFFDEPETILKRKETELQRPPRLFQNDGRETSKAISKIKRTKEITRKRPFC